VRLIAASKAPLNKSQLRSDLAERLAEGHLIPVPRLEDRKRDIPGLIHYFLEEIKDASAVDSHFSEDAIKCCMEQSWPGQIRELRALVRELVHAARARADINRTKLKKVVVQKSDVERRIEKRRMMFGDDTQEDTDNKRRARGKSAEAIAKATKIRISSGRAISLDKKSVNPRSLTREDIVGALAAHDGNKAQAARSLGIARNTLVNKMGRFGIK
jgi:DNA-binding NtrC family response regulator